ncbi:ATP-grasp domain-containing protein [Treponema pedis]|uniref:ATP-grasp domain-containing protein n=1 Tax=Treponema pedis TaxID=409322 RepID=A0A7S6WRK0_9SPIR|nr:ATP-grasp domain-containing protein [Treponema pedis]QOW61704.1 ATP-grasp domain-containing protein [Treponema pedis]
MINILFCNAGRRGKLLLNAKHSLADRGNIVATSQTEYSPALYCADKRYLTSAIEDPAYIDCVLSICKREHINAITTLIDPEISILAKHRDLFEELGIHVFTPDKQTADICFNKFLFFEYLTECKIDTVRTFRNIASFRQSYNEKKIDFPVFIKPISGSGSVGARKVLSMSELEWLCYEKAYDYIIQEFMDAEDIDADVYVDYYTNQAVSAFSKRKLETRIGGANKTISFKDDKLFKTIQNVVSKFKFYGTIDIDFFYKDGIYYVSEINPRFGGGYLHPYGVGLDFFNMMFNNINGKKNIPVFGNYEDGSIMMMYDDVVVLKSEEIMKYDKK